MKLNIVFVLSLISASAFAADSTKVAPTYEAVMRYIDTVSETDDGSFFYLSPTEKQREIRRYHEKTAVPNDDPLEPTHYPSPFSRKFEA